MAWSATGRRVRAEKEEQALAAMLRGGKMLGSRKGNGEVENKGDKGKGEHTENAGAEVSDGGLHAELYVGLPVAKLATIALHI
jgi:hypothetical protein